MALRYLLLLASAAIVAPAHAQPKLVYHLPAAEHVQVDTNIVFRRAATQPMRFDLYRPEGVDRSRPLPAVVFFNSGSPAYKNFDIVVAWARLVAASGLAAITYESARADFRENFDGLIDHLRSPGAAHGIDADRLAVFAPSGNAYAGMPVMMDSSRTYLRAAVFYYGAPPDLGRVRLDLPTLLVRSGLDDPGTNENLDAVMAKALALNAPFTLINLPNAHHPFEETDANDVSRMGIQATLAFLATHLKGGITEALAEDAHEMSAAGAFARKDWAGAIAAYERLAAAGDPEFTRKLADSRFEAGDYAGAARDYDRALTLGSWRRGQVSAGAMAASWRIGDADAQKRWASELAKTPWTLQVLSNNHHLSTVWGEPGFEAFMRQYVKR